MIDVIHGRKWFYWALFAALAGLILFVQLIPLQTTPSNWAMPDSTLGCCGAMITRRCC